jgi:hypothetical protein
MKSNFDKTLKLSADGRKVTVSGPLDWSKGGADGTEVTRILVTVTQQQGAGATYASGSQEKKLKDSTLSWGPFDITVDRDDPPLMHGGALAGGVLFTNGSGDSKWWPWPDTVQLVP